VESEPNNLFADSIAPVRRTMPGEVFFIRMEASPEPGSDDFGTEGGGFVNCYVDADDLRAAELRAISLIRDHGWQPLRFETWELTCGECANDTQSEDDAPTSRELVERALLDGECCVFFTWPIDAHDANHPDA
jgi:hypothetical protein